MSVAPPLTPERARAWGKYAETSPLYQRLNEVVAGDNSLMSVLNSIEHTPRQNILFAGVQYLMLRDGGGELAQYFPNFTDRPRDLADVAGTLTEFVTAHADELSEIGRTRFTQTNECRRCVALLPGIWATPAERFHLIDFGTSAGLNLQLDRYAYRWDGTTWGPDSPVLLETESRGAEVSPREIEVLTRIGLDLDPVDPTDHDARLWLEALIWPEHHERRHRLRAALDLAAADPPQLVTGDALTTLGPAIDELPADAPVVVINSFILNQIPRADRTRYDDILNERRSHRPIYRVSMEWLDPSADAADLAVDDGSGLRQVGAAQPHGEWLELQ
ncbi:MAG: DUF2332 domain-containing protein [Acidimicrobiia bacterium]